MITHSLMLGIAVMFILLLFLYIYLGKQQLRHLARLGIEPSHRRAPVPVNKTPLNRGTAAIPLLFLSHEKKSIPFPLLKW